MTVSINKNNSQLAFSNLRTLKTTLYSSKEDIELYHFMLSVIASRHPEISKRNRAIFFLVKQIKIEHHLDKIIDKCMQLNNYWRVGNVTSTRNQEIIQQLKQLHTEINLFNKIHLELKRTYIRFTRNNIN